MSSPREETISKFGSKFVSVQLRSALVRHRVGIHAGSVLGHASARYRFGIRIDAVGFTRKTLYETHPLQGREAHNVITFYAASRHIRRRRPKWAILENVCGCLIDIPGCEQAGKLHAADTHLTLMAPCMSASMLRPL